MRWQLKFGALNIQTSLLLKTASPSVRNKVFQQQGYDLKKS